MSILPTDRLTPIAQWAAPTPDQFRAGILAGEGGDATFIPRGWYHNVEAIERFDVLVNYSWDAAAFDDD